MMSALDELYKKWDVWALGGHPDGVITAAEIVIVSSVNATQSGKEAAAAELAELRARLAELEGQNKTLVEPDYDCVYCKDTGKATWTLDGKKYTTPRCPICGKRNNKPPAE